MKIFVVFLLTMCACGIIVTGNEYLEDPSVDSEDISDAITGFAVAAAVEDESNTTGGPSVTDIKMATKWLNGIQSEVSNGTIVDLNETTNAFELNKNNDIEIDLGENKSSNDGFSSEKTFENSDTIINNESTNASVSTNIENPSVLQLLKEQIQNDFRPIILILDYLIPNPVKSFLLAQFSVVSKQLVLILSGAFSPMLSTAARVLLFTGEALVSLSQKMTQMDAKKDALVQPSQVEDVVAINSSVELREDELVVADNDKQESNDLEIIDEDSEYDENDSTEELEIVEED